MLLPARTDTKWFHEYIYHKTEIRFIKGRLKFGGAANSAPFPSMVVVFRPRIVGKKGEDGMKQYCRYCIYLCTGNGIWCDKKQREMTWSATTHINHCNDFEFCKEDAYMITDGYKPHRKRKKQCDGQLSLNFENEGEDGRT